MDVSREQPKMAAGLDPGDKCSYLCLIATLSGEVIEEGRLRTIQEVLRRRFASERPLRIAVETGTHSSWVSRFSEECCHEVLVANTRKLRLIYSNRPEGIGPLTALTFVLTLEDPYRFEKSRSVGAYLGLVPATDRSGDSDLQKCICRRRSQPPDSRGELRRGGW